MSNKRVKYTLTKRKFKTFTTRDESGKTIKRRRITSETKNVQYFSGPLSQTIAFEHGKNPRPINAPEDDDNIQEDEVVQSPPIPETFDYSDDCHNYGLTDVCPHDDDSGCPEYCTYRNERN
jgi:hypothetical protein